MARASDLADTSIEAALASFAAEFRPHEVAGSARAFTKQLLIDAVGCALIGSRAKELREVAAAAAITFGPGTSTVIGSSERLSPAGATMLNAYLVTAMTLCDVYRPAHCHMTPLVIPPALAAAEAVGASGLEFITAVTLGMEVMARVARGLDYQEFRSRGWHSPGVIGPLGAAVAVGRIEGQDSMTIRHGLGLAASQAGGSYLSWGTPAVKFHQARGAVSGLLAARLAGEGFSGGKYPLTAIDGGIYHTHSNGGRPKAAVERLGELWELEQISLRLWPGASPVQAMLTGLLELIERESLRVEDVASVEIGISTEDFGTHSGFAQPRNTFEALLSYAYLCAVALYDRKLWFEQVEHPRLSDPAVLGFASHHVAVVPQPDLPVNGCTIKIEARHGSLLERRVESSRGTPEDPATESEVDEKFRLCAAAKLGQAGATDLLAALKSIDDISDVSVLCRMLRGQAR